MASTERADDIAFPAPVVHYQTPMEYGTCLSRATIYLAGQLYVIDSTMYVIDSTIEELGATAVTTPPGLNASCLRLV